MRFSSLTQRIHPDTGDAWRVHTLAGERRARGEDIIMLSIGEEIDEQTDAEVVEAAVNSLRSGQHHYSEVRGAEPLRAAIARHHGNLTGQHVSADHCTVYAGAQNALFATAQCLLESGDSVLLPEPYYTTYPGVFTGTGARAIPVAGTAARGFLPSAQQLIDAIENDSRAIVITQPSNPMGAFLPAEELQLLVNACNERDIWLISDEVYAPLVNADIRASAAHCEGAERCCITIGSLSKSHRMTGWRIGWTVTPLALAEHLAALSLCMHYGLPPFIMEAAIAALDDNGKTAAAIAASMLERRRVCQEYLGDLSPVRLLDSGYGMFVIFDLSDTGIEAETYAEQLLEQHAVAVLPCTGFGPTGRHLVRIGLCVQADQLTLACQRIATFTRSLLPSS